MGHWRLMFQFAFADLLGYKYLWQIDDDTEFKARETVNITDFMQGRLVAGASCLQSACLRYVYADRAMIPAVLPCHLILSLCSRLTGA
jgi:hypothetical protein